MLDSQQRLPQLSPGVLVRHVALEVSSRILLESKLRHILVSLYPMERNILKRGTERIVLKKRSEYLQY